MRGIIKLISAAVDAVCGRAQQMQAAIIPSSNSYHYQDEKLDLDIYHLDSPAPLYINAVKKNNGKILTFDRLGGRSRCKFHWGGSPVGVSDHPKDGKSGISQVITYDRGVEGFTVEKLAFGGFKLSWFAKVTQYATNREVGIQVNGSYEVPYNTGVIKIWHRFLVLDIEKFRDIYNTASFSGFSSNFDLPGSFSDFVWPSRITRTSSDRIYPPDNTDEAMAHSYAIGGNGDWRQPFTSWGEGSCRGENLYRPPSSQPNYGLFRRKIADARCYNERDDHPPGNLAFGTPVRGTQINPRGAFDQDILPYMIHYAPSLEYCFMRVLTGNVNRRLTFQTYDNGEDPPKGPGRDKEHSSGVSWDWGDMHFGKWPHQQTWRKRHPGIYYHPAWDTLHQDPPGKPFNAPVLQNGFVIESNEEIWCGEGTPEDIRTWAKTTPSSLRRNIF